ncbi:serine-rich adhesin for platelets-like isoform X3 [Montipora capricornis]|uniref:serine-rich adhesin for platelets-like isoform X3 n=1 Tax=Montipora capricornis TaxID=246305 RepID=UPI0035F1EF39
MSGWRNQEGISENFFGGLTFNPGEASFSDWTNTDSIGFSPSADSLFPAANTGYVSTSASETGGLTDFISGTLATQQFSSLFERGSTDSIGFSPSADSLFPAANTGYVSTSTSETGGLTDFISGTLATQQFSSLFERGSTDSIGFSPSADSLFPAANTGYVSTSTSETGGLTDFISGTLATQQFSSLFERGSTEMLRNLQAKEDETYKPMTETSIPGEMLRKLRAKEDEKYEPMIKIPIPRDGEQRSSRNVMHEEGEKEESEQFRDTNVNKEPKAQASSSATSVHFSDEAKTTYTPITRNGERRSSRNVAYEEGEGATSVQFRDTNVNEEPKVHQSLTMATTEIVQKSVEATFKEMKKYSPEDYAKIEADPRFKESITEAATRAAREQVEFDREFLHNRGEDIVSLLKERLSMERIQLIQEAFTIPTFDMTLKRIRNGGKDVMLVEFKMEDEEFRPPLKIETPDDINGAKVWQYASIAIEGFMFLKAAAGLTDDLTAITKTAMKYTAGNAATRMKESSKARKALDDFVKSWRTAGSNYWKKGKALYVLLRDSLVGGLLWTIHESWHNRKEMSRCEWAKTSVKVTATMFAAFDTGGRALIAQIVLALMSADSLRNDANRMEQKIRNVTKLEGFEKNLYESKQTDSGCVTF